MAIRFSAVALGMAMALPAGPLWAYEGDVHQQLTFIAARQYNRCAEDTHLARLTSLQVRYVALANANQAESPWWQFRSGWKVCVDCRRMTGPQTKKIPKPEWMGWPVTSSGVGLGWTNDRSTSGSTVR